jgi:molybdopterin-containing oxidoreductase family iron-sulfur binding subunit
VPGLRVTIDGRSIEIPAWIQPGHPDNVITLYLGGGRRSGGNVQQGVGVDLHPLRTSGRLWSAAGADVHVEPISRRFTVAATQSYQVMSDREVARTIAVADLPKQKVAPDKPDLYSTTTDAAGRKVHLSLYDETRYAGYKWGMVIDLSACIGCQACVVACQAENNIPCVGKEQVRRGREMHWIRIDTYYGPTSAAALSEVGPNPVIHFQPMLCQHCENAPCELVCPVEATSHSEEGINEMTYNRCIGTRYCSNNCPYKVRRFNFYQYNGTSLQGDQATLAMQKNPNVTVRSRGVMEKCTYCIQRINRARIGAKRQWARNSTEPDHVPAPEMRTTHPDGWVTPTNLPRLRPQTACQQACPAEAIVFGDLNDSEALVTRLKSAAPWNSINYGVLTELNTQPRTSYLERLTNPNPALVTPLPPSLPASPATEINRTGSRPVSSVGAAQSPAGGAA